MGINILFNSTETYYILYITLFSIVSSVFSRGVCLLRRKLSELELPGHVNQQDESKSGVNFFYAVVYLIPFMHKIHNTYSPLWPTSPS